MNAFKKTIFLSNKSNNSQKCMCILTLEKKNNGHFCTLKTYNIDLNKDLVLGIKSEDKIIKQNIILNNGSYNFLINQNFDLNNNISCVLLEVKDKDMVPVAWGSEKSENYKIQIINNLKNSISKLSKLEKKDTKSSNLINENLLINDMKNENNLYDTSLNNDKENYLNNSIEELQDNYTQISLQEEEIHNQDDVAQVANISSLFESSDEEINEDIDNAMNTENEPLNKNNKEHKFYSMIAEQLEELFDKYPREDNLEKLVENSRWVKINFEDNDKYYVVGIIYMNNDIKYICYGVPGEFNTEPPRELKEYSQWLPTNTSNPYTNGYWVMYQDADSGENVIIN